MSPGKFKNILLSLWLAFLATFAWISCRGDGMGLNVSGDPEEFTGFAALIQPIFDTNCIRCHSPGGVGFMQTGGSDNNGLDLTRGNSHRNLVNQPTFELPNTEPKMRVAPGNPDGSYIIEKITSASPKFGNRMPLDGPPFLSQSEIQLIRDWIAQEALNN